MSEAPRKPFWSTASELPEDVFAAWHKPGLAISPVAIVATVDADGTPRTAPFGSLVAVTPRYCDCALFTGMTLTPTSAAMDG